MGDEFRQRLEVLKRHCLELEAKLKLLSKQLEEIQEHKHCAEERLEALVRLRGIIQKAVDMTQSQIKSRISTLVTKALSIVFPDPYQFEVDFVSRRGKVECDLWFVRDGERIAPVEASGGGPVDVASFALRLAFWTLVRARPVLILDETFRFVSADLQPKCSEMLKTLSQKLGIQILIVSHSSHIADFADKVFVVQKVGNVSKVTQK